jgi:hypothetical protein
MSVKTAGAGINKGLKNIIAQSGRDTLFICIDKRDSTHYKIVDNLVAKNDQIKNFLVFADKKFQWRNFLFEGKSEPYRAEKNIDNIKCVSPDELALMFSKRDYSLFRTETFVVIYEKDADFLFSLVRGFHNGARLQNDVDEEPGSKKSKN